MIPKNLKVVFDKTSKISGALNSLARTQVLAGVPEQEDSRDGDSPINNAALMYIHENGAPEAGIPPRPVVHPAIRSIQDQATKILRQIGSWAMEGSTEKVEKGFNAIGILAQNAMRRYITTGPLQPIKPGTIAARKRRGISGIRPLIATGQLRRALTYVVWKR